MVPDEYCKGMSQPPNGVILAPRARCSASSGEYRRSLTSADAAQSEIGIQRDDLVVDLILHLCQRQKVENSLTPTNHVDEIVTTAQDDAGPFDHEMSRRDVVVDVTPEIGEDVPDRLEADAGIEKALDHAQFEEIAVAVVATGATPLGIVHGGANEVGASPVVELAVRDSDDVGGLRS
jgi:hypothetical protein